MASFPSAVKSFTTKNAGDTIQPAHINDLQDEIAALEDGLLNGTAPLNSSRITAPGLSISGGSTFAGSAVFSTTVTLTGGQIAFPATQVPSAGVNTLDDYEEGSWTPVVGGSGGTSGQTYAFRTARYIKVGRLVYCTFDVRFSTKGTITSNVQVQGLPFTPSLLGANAMGTASVHFQNMTNTFTNIVGLVDDGVPTVTLYGVGAAATQLTVLTTGDLSNTTIMIGSFTYLAEN